MDERGFIKMIRQNPTLLDKITIAARLSLAGAPYL